VLLHEEALVIILKNDPGLTALVGSRIYPGVLPQLVVFPAIAYRLTNREHMERLEQRGSAGLVRSTFRLYSCSKGTSGVSSAYGETKKVDAAVIQCLLGFHGTVSNTGTPPASLEVQHVRHVNTLEFYDDATETWQVVTEVDFWAAFERPPALV
jgi:hypothetical protein